MAIEVRLPDRLDDDARAQLLAAELARGRELKRNGVIQSIWRVPGAQRNVGIWRTEDADALHEAICSLPLYPWMSTQVTALAGHPLDHGATDDA